MRNIFIKNKKRGYQESGYTIIEMMIAVSLFLVVVMAGMTALLNANVVHQKSQNMRSILDNLSFIMEDMSRNLRTGSTYHCSYGADTPSTTGGAARSNPTGTNCWGVAFEPANGSSATLDDQWLYYISNGQVWKTTHLATMSDATQMTPDEVIISSVSGFQILGAEASPANQQQPMVIIRLAGTISYKNGTVLTPFSLQTSVSQRYLDVN